MLPITVLLTIFSNDHGVAGLRNGLSERDNLRLFETDDLDEMISLLLQGLNALRSAGR